MSRLIIPAIALLIFILESVFANLFAGRLFGDGWILAPRLTIVFISFLTIYQNRRTAMLYGFIIGLCYDIAYTGVLGVYLFALPAAAYFISKSMSILQTNLLTASLVTAVFIAVIETAVFQLNMLLGFTAMDYGDFAQIRLVPTLIMNLVLTLILYYPLKQTMERLAVSAELD